MASAYEMFFNPDGTYKTSAQYEAEAGGDDLDLLTAAELRTHHDRAYEEHTRLYDRSRALPVTHPEFPVVLAAMCDLGEHLRAIGAVIKAREAEETAGA